MITMSAREEGRLRVLEQVLHGKLSQAQAAELLEMSVRQVRRLQRRYGLEGAAGLVHERRRTDKTHPGKRWVGTTPNPQFQPIVPP